MHQVRLIRKKRPDGVFCGFAATREIRAEVTFRLDRVYFPRADDVPPPSAVAHVHTLKDILLIVPHGRVDDRHDDCGSDVVAAWAAII
jgi:hypothetical protein